MILETSDESQKMGCFSGDSIVYQVIEKKKELEKQVIGMLEKVNIK
jgi:hypothetical protein